MPIERMDNVEVSEVVDFMNRTYDDIIHWRKNLFKLPAGKASSLFIIILPSG